MTELVYELTNFEQEDSLPLVCYERSLYHFLRRNESFDGFYLLYADRHYHMHYVPDQNEALQFENDGLTRFLPRFEGVETPHRDQVIDRLRDRLGSGWQARTMLMTTRPDGSVYPTSTLIEEATPTGFLITKTNEHMRRTRTPVSEEDLLTRFRFTDEGATQIGFLRLDSELRDDLLSYRGIDLFFHIVRDIFGYALEADELVMDGTRVHLPESALWALHKSIQQDPDSLLHIQSSKGLQLRLNKHIGNKLQPLWHAWSTYIAPLITPQIPTAMIDALTDADSHCREAYADLQTRFVVLCGRPTPRSVDSYIRSLGALATRYDKWAESADTCFRLALD